MVFLVIYYILTILFCVLGLIACKKYVKTDRARDLIFKIVAIVTVILHYSILWVEYLQNGKVEVPNSLLFPIYPCHIVMWIALITALWKNKSSRVFQFLVISMFFIGTICCSIGIVFNENYLASPNEVGYEVVKGLISHSTLLFCCLYVFVMGYLKVNFINNFIGVIMGLLLLLVQGTIINTLFKICGLDSVNAMYMQEPPFANLPFINTLTIGVAGVIVSFCWILLLEHFFVPKEQRFFIKLKKRKEVKR